jgi:hypothetical protein
MPPKTRNIYNKTVSKKSCKNGTRRNLSGKCVKEKIFVEKIMNRVEQSMRMRQRDLTRATHKTQSIQLLGNTQIFQVSFDKSRLQTYKPVIPVESVMDIQQPESVTLLNTSLALGLIDINEAMKNAEHAKRHHISFYRYLANLFQISEDNIDYRPLTNHNGDLPKKLHENLSQLKLNHATIITISCIHNRLLQMWRQHIIAFKHKRNKRKIITYFDPQTNRYMSSIDDFFPNQNKTPLFEIISCFIYTQSHNANASLKNVSDLPLEEDSPRTKYYNTYFNKPVKLLGRHSMVQFSFTSEQFENYVVFNRLSNGSLLASGSCVLHGLFSLGLRSSTQIKHDSLRMYDKSVQGISPESYIRYLEKITKLPKKSIIFITSEKRSIKMKDDEVTSASRVDFETEIKEYMDSHLKNNHATIILVGNINRANNKHDIHAIVVYKKYNKIKYFDPQMSLIDKYNTGYSTVKECMRYYGDMFFTFFITFHINNYEKQDDILIDDERSCYIPFGNSPENSSS